MIKHLLPVGISLPEKQYTLHFADVRVPASALVDGADYARTRSVWGPAIGSYQAISHPLAKANIEVDGKAVTVVIDMASSS